MGLKSRYRITKSLMLLLLSITPFFQSEAQRIFWTERFNDRVMVSSDIVNISSPTALSTNLMSVTYLEYDQSSGFFAVVLFGDQGLYRLNLDGTGLKEVFDSGSMTGFNDIEINFDDGLIYASKGSEDPGGVFYYDISDNNVPSAENQMVMAGTGPGVPNDDYTAIAYNSAGNNVFLSRPGGSDVFVSSDPLGNVIAGGNQGVAPDRMEIDENNNKLYYVIGDVLSRSNLDLNSAEQLVDAGTQIFDIEIYPNVGVYYCTNAGIYYFDFELESNTLLYSQTGVRGLAVERDFTRPVVQNYTPIQGQSGVAIGATQFSLRFDEDIKTSITGASGTDVQIQVFRNGSLFESINRNSANLTFSGQDLIIDLTNPLTVGDYHVLIGGNVISNVSNLDYQGISNTTTWDFTVECDDPTIQTSGLSVTTAGNGFVDLSWTNGDGDHTIILAKNGSPVDADPVDLTTYTANGQFGVGDEIGTGNFVVFNGSVVTSTSVFDLDDGITHFAAYSYNVANQCYLTTSPSLIQGPDYVADIINPMGPGDIDPLSTDEVIFSFEIVGGASEMLIREINFVNGGLDAIDDWTELIADVWLEDDGGNQHMLSDGGALAATTVDFNNLNTSTIGNVPGGGSKVYEVHVQFRTTLGGTLPQTVDNLPVEFDTSSDLIILDPTTGTGFLQSTFLTASAGANSIRVISSEIRVTQQPSTTVNQLTALPQQPIFEATDANGNRDLDFTDTFVVGTADPDDLSPVSAPNAFTLGVADFSGSGFNFEEPGTSTMHVSASPSNITSANTSSVTVSALTPVLLASDVVTVGSINCVNDNGSITVVSIFPDAVSDYTFRLEDSGGVQVAGTGPAYIGLAPDTYTLFATNNNSSLTSAGLNITINFIGADPTISESITPNSSCVGSNGAINLTIDGGAPSIGYTFEWFEGMDTTTPLTVGTINANQVQDLPGGFYTVRVTSNITGCFSEMTFEVPSSLAIPLLPTAITNTGCNGDAMPDFEIDFGATSSVVNWYDDDPGVGGNLITNSSGVNSKTLPAADFPGGVSGTGTFTVFANYVDASNGCESSAVSTDIVINPLPSGTLVVTSDFNGFGVSCNGFSDGQAAITATSGTGPFLFELVETGANIMDAANSAVFTTLAAGDYTARITDANGCTALTSVITITEPVAISTTITVSSDFNGAQISCSGSSDGELTVTASNGAQPYTYSIVEIPSNTSGVSSGIFTGLLAGTYTVQVTDANSCPVTTNAVTLTEPAQISATPSVIQNISCAGNSDGEISFTGIGGTGNLTYLLNEIPSNTTGESTGIFTGLPQGNYTVDITDQNNCVFTTISEQVNDPAAYSASLSNDATICEGESTTLNLSITGGAAPYSVNIDNLGVVSSDGVTVQVTPAATTTFSLISVTDVNGCDASTVSGSATITVDQNPTVAMAGDNQEICEDNTTLNANNAIVGTGVWALVSGTGTIVSTSSPTTRVNNVGSGVNVFSWTISNGICAVSTSEVTITRLASPEGRGIITSTNGNNTFCQQTSDITLNVAGITDATTYNWTLIDGSNIVTEEPTITFDLAADAQSGVVSVIGENVCGSGEASGAFNIDIIAAPTVTIVAADAIFPNLETMFSFSSSETINDISWDLGDGSSSTAESPVHIYTEPGTYTVTLSGTGTGGCEVSVAQQVMVNLADPISIKNAITPNGDGANDQLIIINIEFYPNNVVTLFDRWGVEVASFEGYRNEWDLTVGGNIIPAGNYICVVELPSIDEVVKRTITVVRSSN